MASGNESRQVVIRNVDPALWRWVRAEAVKRELTAGAFLNEIIRDRIEQAKGD